MDQFELLLSLRCPDHNSQAIEMLNTDPNAKKLGYCFKCIEENQKNGAPIEALESISTYLENKSGLYDKCREMVKNAGEPPAEYTEVFSKKEEQMNAFSKHIDQEKDRVVNSFEEIEKILMQIVNEKKEECLKVLDNELLDLSEAYLKFEELFKMVWPKESEIQNIYPNIDILNERMSQIESMDQLHLFLTKIQEDVQKQNSYFQEEEDSLSKIRKKMDGLVRGFNTPERSLPKIQGQILDKENLEYLMKDLMKEFSQEKVQVENSILSRMKVLVYESKIIIDDQFETLRDWLPKRYKFDLKLLYRGSVDGMSSEKFHEKCDEKGATITLIKCRFDGALISSTLGGFKPQSFLSWTPNRVYSDNDLYPKEEFIFSLAGQSGNSVKYHVLGPIIGRSFPLNRLNGPAFGDGYDLYIHQGFKTGTVSPESDAQFTSFIKFYGCSFFYSSKLCLRKKLASELLERGLCYSLN